MLVASCLTAMAASAAKPRPARLARRRLARACTCRKSVRHASLRTPDFMGSYEKKLCEIFSRGARTCDEIWDAKFGWGLQVV